MRTLIMVLALCGSAWAQSALEFKTNDGGGSPQVRFSITSGASAAITASVATSVVVDDANTNTVVDVLTLDHTTTGTAANNIGTGILFRAEDAAGTTENVAEIQAVLWDATDATEDGRLVFRTRGPNGGALADRVKIGA